MGEARPDIPIRVQEVSVQLGGVAVLSGITLIFQRKQELRSARAVKQREVVWREMWKDA